MRKSFVLYNLFMNHLLHLDSSLRTEGSRSRRLTAAQFTAPSDHTPEQAAAHALTEALIGEVIAADTVLAELTLARESPAMIPLGLGEAEDKSMADALAAVDALVEV